jgi:hypothetical protein
VNYLTLPRPIPDLVYGVWADGPSTRTTKYLAGLRGRNRRGMAMTDNWAEAPSFGSLALNELQKPRRNLDLPSWIGAAGLPHKTSD